MRLREWWRRKHPRPEPPKRPEGVPKAFMFYAAGDVPVPEGWNDPPTDSETKGEP